VLNCSRSELGELVRSVTREFERSPGAEGYPILLREADAPISGLWDQPRLERVLRNLLENATKYSPRGSEIIVSVGSEDDERGRPLGTFSVTDHGIGVPDADLSLIFERFHRASNVGTTPGTGIGLAGARQIVEQHGGRIDVQSREGHGSTFIVRLPLEQGKGTA
jgi:signal transduction histidine kinase